MLYQYNYNGNSKPDSITNIAGQSIQFTWVNGRVSQITDPNGKVWSYEYNAAGRLWKTTSPGADPDVREYHYEHAADNALLTGITVNGARYSTYKYDAAKRVVESGLSTAEDVDTFVYANKQTTVASAKGQPVTYTFLGDAATALKLSGISSSATSSCPSASASTQYDANGYIDYTLDWNGNKTDYFYDTAGRLKQLTTAAGTTAALTKVHTWTGDDITRTDYKDASGLTYAQITYTYVPSGKGKGELDSETRLDLLSGTQHKTTYAYTFHPSGALASKVKARDIPGGSASSTWVYDALGNLTAYTNALSQTEYWSNYNGLGLPGRHQSINGVITDFAYDDKGNLSTATTTLENGPRTTAYTFNHMRQVTDILRADLSAQRFRYDAAGALKQMGDVSGQFSTRGWAAATNTETWTTARQVPALSGGVPAAVDGGSFVQTTRLDSRGRPWIAAGNNGQQITFTRDGNGNVLTRTDAGNRQTVSMYDAQGRLDWVTMPDGGTIDHAYDKRGNLASVKDPRGLITTYTHDAWGRVLTRASPDTGETTYTYDMAGRPLTERRAGGQYIEYSYDALDRIASRKVNGQPETYGYDAGTYGKG